jgi:tRNA (guanine37-N1)-methyltransferase
MPSISVPLAHAQQVKEYLIKHELFDRSYRIKRTADALVFPITREFSPPFDFDVEFVQEVLDERQLSQSLREAIRPYLTPDEAARMRASYDIVGSIAILDVPPELEAKEALIGEKVLAANKTISTVLKKTGAHEGVYRTQRMQCIGGEDTRETIVIENGVKLRVNVETAYYSIRMATERKRIAQLIKPGERVLCLFSGIGPYPVTFYRLTQAADIVGIEINPQAHELAVENVAKNRCMNVRLFCGDAHDLLPRLVEAGEHFDRVTMPLPHTADEFLEDLLPLLHVGSVIHFYDFLEEDAFNSSVPKLRDVCARAGFGIARYDVVRAGQHAPRIWRICIDATLGKLV